MAETDLDSEDQPSSCPRFWLKALPIIFVILLAGAFAFLAFGNCQWTRWNYIFQAYYWPGYKDNIVPMPKNYTGVWSDWRDDGSLVYMADVRQGQFNGNYEGYCEHELFLGCEYAKGKYVNGVAQGHWLVRHHRITASGQLLNGKMEGVWRQTSYYPGRYLDREVSTRLIETTYKNGVLNGPYTVCDEDKRKVARQYYRNGSVCGPSLIWDIKGKVKFVEYFLAGKKCTKAEYIQARGKDPTLPSPVELHSTYATGAVEREGSNGN